MPKIKSLFGGLFIIASMLISTQTFADNANVKSEPKKVTTSMQTETKLPKTSNKTTSDPIILGDKVNINTATVNEIKNILTGIGEKKAMAIIDYRKTHGNFTTIEQLTEVKGIGKSTLEKNKGRIIL